MKLVLATGLAVTLFSTAAFAAAPNAVMNHDADVHQSNSNGSAVVNDVSDGDEVTVIKCSTSWCYISIDGPDGWVKKKYLDNMDDSGAATPNIPFSLTIGPGGPSITFGTPTPPPPSPPPAAPQACFFADPNFGGYNACYTPGDSDADMSITGPGYDNAISSIKLTGGAKVKVCTDANYAGSCATFSSDKPYLGGYNDTISSFVVY
jgi:Bacterial SH3 domain/Peptidase inhibitor family I36